MRTWLCLSLIKRSNRISSSSQLLASCSIESLEISSINETTAALSATFLRCTVICVILNHKSFSGSSQRNTLIVCQVLQHAEHNHVIFWHLFTFTSNPRLQYKLTYLAKSSVSNTFAQLPLSKRMDYKESCECVQLLGF